MDNLHGTGEAMTTLLRAAGRKNKVHSMENLDCVYEDSGINNGRCRRFAWPETEGMEDCRNALARQWVRDLQVLKLAHGGQKYDA